jgi:ketol-acid reductoisomerase
VDDHTTAKMQVVLKEIQDGTFARNWVSEYEAGLPEYNRLMQEDLNSRIEQVGAQLRGRMAWLKE